LHWNQSIHPAFCVDKTGSSGISEPAHQIEAGVRKGGYIIQDSERPEINLVATGSEVSLALEIAEKMKDRQIRVVSLPCWEIFDQQSETYRNDIIPNRGCLNVSIEAGITLGWQKYVG
jgi:transketolase